MKKVLIIGNELHAVRYISSLIFVKDIELTILNDSDATNNIKEYYNILELNIENDLFDKINVFDYIIYTIPNGLDINVCNLLKKYRGYLLMEKPQMNIKLLKELKCKTYFIHLRKFCYIIYNKPAEINYIEWPNLAHEGMDGIINTLPNVVDYINDLYKENKVSKEKIYDIKNDSNSIKFKIDLDEKFYINIYNTKEKNKHPTINGENIEWPNYFECINNLAKEIENDNYYLFNTLEEEIVNIEIINKIRGDNYGY